MPMAFWVNSHYKIQTCAGWNQHHEKLADPGQQLPIALKEY